MIKTNYIIFKKTYFRILKNIYKPHFIYILSAYSKFLYTHHLFNLIGKIFALFSRIVLIGGHIACSCKAYVNIFGNYGQYFTHFPTENAGFSAGLGSVDVRVLLNEREAKGNPIINFKEHNGGRKAHVKFSLLITTSHTMEALPHQPEPEMWCSLPCFKLSPPPTARIILILIKCNVMPLAVNSCTLVYLCCPCFLGMSCEND